MLVSLDYTEQICIVFVTIFRHKSTSYVIITYCIWTVLINSTETSLLLYRLTSNQIVVITLIIWIVVHHVRSVFHIIILIA